MRTTSGRRSARLITAIGLAVAAALSSGATATAGSQTAHLVGSWGGVYAIDFGANGLKAPALFRYDRTGDGVADFNAYCIEPTVQSTSTTLTDYGIEHVTGAANLGKVRWVLQNSFPKLTLAALSTKAGLKPTAQNDYFDEGTAAAATQAAIWHFAYGYDVRTGFRYNPQSTADALVDSDNFWRAYTYLVTKAVNVTDGAGAQADLAPASAAGRPGRLIGPITFTGSGKGTLTAVGMPSGVRLVDAAGAALPATILPGTQIYAAVPAEQPAGSFTVKVAVSGSAPTVVWDWTNTQTFIEVPSAGSKAKDTATFTWSRTEY